MENTLHYCVQSNDQQDHLHTRGEYYCRTNCVYFLLGSPPHTWRIPQHKCSVFRTNGITSTHVENTLSSFELGRSSKDHLHTRGEYNLLIFVGGRTIGSPPHTWRIQLQTLIKLKCAGITSTHVENTVNKSQYNNNHKTIDPKISSLCQLLLYLFLSH